jgi:hypothetical protein
LVEHHYHPHGLRGQAYVVVGVVKIFEALHPAEASPDVVKYKNYAKSHVFENVSALVVCNTVSKISAVP